MERQLQQIAIERQSTEWNIARIDGKMQRRKFTDILAPFQIYALNQGSKGTSLNAYSNFSRLVNKAAGVNEGAAPADRVSGSQLQDRVRTKEGKINRPKMDNIHNSKPIPQQPPEIAAISNGHYDIDKNGNAFPIRAEVRTWSAGLRGGKTRPDLGGWAGVTFEWHPVSQRACRIPVGLLGAICILE